MQRIAGPALSIALAVVVAACGFAADDAAGRERALALVREGRLPAGEGYASLALPDDLDHVSEGGEVAVIGSATAPEAVVFFRFRGLNHYTGWVYSPTPLSEDPLGNQPFEAKPLGGGWYEVNAG